MSDLLLRWGSWEVAEHGYAVSGARNPRRSGRSMWLHEREPARLAGGEPSSAVRRRSFDLATCPEAFLRASRAITVADDQHSALSAFAGSYGLLGHWSSHAPIEVEGAFYRAESLDVWARELHPLCAAAAVAEFIRTNDRSALKRRFAIRAGCVRYEHNPEAAKAGKPRIAYTLQVEQSPDYLESLRAKDPIPAAYALIEQLAHRGLRNGCRQGVWRRSGGEGITLALGLAPRTLLGAMWLHLAISVQTGREFVRCEICGEPFAVDRTKHGKRKDTKYCSNACNQKAYRERMDKAKRLFAGGSSIEVIARTIKSKPDTVRGWVGSA